MTDREARRGGTGASARRVVSDDAMSRPVPENGDIDAAHTTAGPSFAEYLLTLGDAVVAPSCASTGGASVLSGG